MDGLFDNWQLQLQLVGTMLVAMVLGGAIGYEREMKNRPAGFRTHMLVAGAAALLVGLVDLLAHRYSAEVYSDLVRIDPIRLIEAMVAAVGFLGAGTIFRNGSESVITGITTAASLLMVAVIGIAADKGIDLDKLSLAEMQAVEPKIDRSVYRVLTVEASHDVARLRADLEKGKKEFNMLCWDEYTPLRLEALTNSEYMSLLLRGCILNVVGRHGSQEQLGKV